MTVQLNPLYRAGEARKRRRRCVHCDRLYLPSTRTQLYCCLACADAAQEVRDVAS